MEVKLSISSSRRISFASDFKEFDLEVEELDDRNCYQTYRYTGNDIFEEDDDDDFDYVISCFNIFLVLFSVCFFVPEFNYLGMWILNVLFG